MNTESKKYKSMNDYRPKWTVTITNSIIKSLRALGETDKDYETLYIHDRLDSKIIQRWNEILKVDCDILDGCWITINLKQNRDDIWCIFVNIEYNTSGRHSDKISFNNAYPINQKINTDVVKNDILDDIKTHIAKLNETNKSENYIKTNIFSKIHKILN